MPNLTINAELQPWQYAFLTSRAENPALLAAWGTGKSMAAILKVLDSCRRYPGNLIAIFRKERTNLEKSTIPDFKTYTSDFANMVWREQKKEIYIPRYKSTIMFLHADTLGVINNINLGAAWIEQAEEIEDDGSIFDKIGGRCRRGGSGRQCFITANSTDENHWIYRYYKGPGVDKTKFPSWEANTFDNSAFLPADYLERQRSLEKRNPAVYLRYVMNKWGISDDRFILINPAALDALMLVNFVDPDTRRIISCDPSLGGDECVMYVFEGPRLIDQLIVHERDIMKIVVHMLALGHKHKCDTYSVDSIGIGRGIADRLVEVGKKVIDINSATSSMDKRFNNLRAEMWWFVSEAIQAKKVPPIHDPELRRQLSSVRFKILDSSGKVALEPKERTKERIGCSPDRADAYIYGLWGLAQMPEQKPADAWRRAENRRVHSDAHSDWMAQ